MEAPPAVISTDSEWYSEYIKHTDNPEIQQLERQLIESSSKQQVDQDSTKHTEDGSTQNSTASSPLKKNHLFTDTRPPPVSADDIIRSTGVTEEVAAVPRRPATAGGGGSRDGRPTRRVARVTSSVSERIQISTRERPAGAADTGSTQGAGRPAEGGQSQGVGRPAVYQDIIRSLQGLADQDVGAPPAEPPEPTARTVRLSSAVVGRPRPGPNTRPAPSAPHQKPGVKKTTPAARDDVTQRYLAFIDELIQEKQDLAGRCETLASQVAALEERHKQQLTAQRDRHREELQSCKRSMSEAERSKRQKWMEKERERIKETTARGVQPQIEQMMKQHAEETARIRQHYESVLAGGHSGQLDEIRGRLMREKEEAVATERRDAAARFERQAAEQAAQHELHSARLTAEVRELRTQLQAAGAAAAAQREEAQREAERRVREARDHAEEEFREVRRRLQDEAETKCRELRDRLAKETEAALARQREELEAAAQSRHQAELQRLKDERDARLEEVIERLEREVRRAEEGEAERSALKLRKLEEKHTLDLRALESSEERFKSKYLDCRAQLAERDEQLLELRSRVNRKDAEIAEMKQTAELMQQEQQQLGEVIESEFQSQVAELRRAADRWQQRLADAERRHQSELAEQQRLLESCRQQREADLQELHRQIKEALSAKDQKIEELSAANQLSQKKMKQLENLLDKMRLVGCRCGGGSGRN
ncbi:Centrosomal protein [Amphibalanus amphitrite]|uniref:Centrosomal protein n=1 Tax=Amphibalanus amphitrite TaxID=1232801 RepID=A0A6A4VB70_AMPAM|nr:Centrosomal protein [Amphibalanus amphitrite]KAF0291025.1 Centrosomal protein [Amphibalanus amphitrite]